jgi:hypothetical protein
MGHGPRSFLNVNGSIEENKIGGNDHYNERSNRKQKSANCKSRFVHIV